MANSIFTTEELAITSKLAGLILDIAVLAEDIKAKEVLLTEKKKELEKILPNEGFRIKDADNTMLEARWNDKITKTLQKAMVEQNHGITIGDDDYKQTPSHYATVARVKAK